MQQQPNAGDLHGLGEGHREGRLDDAYSMEKFVSSGYIKQLLSDNNVPPFIISAIISTAIT